jgi:hypothetical protein
VATSFSTCTSSLLTVVLAIISPKVSGGWESSRVLHGTHPSLVTVLWDIQFLKKHELVTFHQKNQQEHITNHWKW